MERLVHPDKGWASVMLTSHVDIWWQTFQFSGLTTHTQSITKHRSLSSLGARLPEQLACDQQGLTPSVWWGLGENAGLCSGFSEPAARTCAAELSHVLIFSAASCEEKHQRSGKGPVLWPRKPLFPHLLIWQIARLQKCPEKSGALRRKVCSLGKQSPSSGFSLLERPQFSKALWFMRSTYGIQGSMHFSGLLWELKWKEIRW